MKVLNGMHAADFQKEPTLVTRLVKYLLCGNKS